MACALAPAGEWWVQLYLIHCVTLPNYVAWAVAYTVDVSKYSKTKSRVTSACLSKTCATVDILVYTFAHSTV